MKLRMVGLSMLLAVALWIYIIIPLQIVSIGNTTNVSAYVGITSTNLLVGSPTPLPTTTPTSPSSTSIDSTVLAAWITFAGAIIVAMIGALVGGIGVAVYQSRRNAALEKERAATQLELERERIRFQATMDAARAEEERERQRKEMNDETARTAMERAQTMTEWVQAYRDALHVDLRISQLQILDMSHPLDVTNVFVRVRLHQEPKPGYEVDPALLTAEAQRDPNELLRASRMHLEKRTSTAIDPDEAIRRYKHCVFVGDPGAGKTTLLKYLTLKAAENQLTGLPNLPIHIELNAFASSGYHDLLDFASTRWDDRYGFPKADARACMEEHLKDGQALLLLDALDEAVIGNTTEEADTCYKNG